MCVEREKVDCMLLSHPPLLPIARRESNFPLLQYYRASRGCKCEPAHVRAEPRRTASAPAALRPSPCAVSDAAESLCYVWQARKGSKEKSDWQIERMLDEVGSKRFAADRLNQGDV